MIKKTLYFGNPAYLSLRNEQLIIKLPEIEKNDSLPDHFKKVSEASFPIEDLGVVMLDHKQITLTHGLIEKLLANNVALLTCDSTRMPVGMMLPLSKNTLQSERFASQINASDPLKKNLWQQTIKAKITNQARVLKKHRTCNIRNMLYWAGEVKSGDADNHEARSAAYYWKEAFPMIDNFTRGRDCDPPNNLLNYGYAVLRAVIARSLVGSGLLPTLGIHHHNRYNAYCLADDIMEPYRPFVDDLVFSIVKSGENYSELTTSVKAKLLAIPTIDVMIEKRRSPLMVAAGQTAASLNLCFEGKLRRIKYPELL
ncbi:type II CRISPR-associated endonuclease Cas1 [Massilibacteroides vaginae]|uniref:type II CRISPR-associated endonuclease Cas1 n=1 Tax=Massilibacteroides vaginae TaxID=1673718 RepID=UPI000A1CA6D9|nr:type II CRISPR-associated endonuclease Cas1 [Massilibacteroides vaginae]